MSASLSTEEKRNEVNQAACTNASYQTDNLKLKPKDNSSTMLSSSSSSLPPSPGQVQSPKSTTRSQSTCRSFTVPKTSAQFQADWRELQKNPEQLFHYFKVSSTCILLCSTVCFSLLPLFAGLCR